MTITANQLAAALRRAAIIAVSIVIMTGLSGIGIWAFGSLSAFIFSTTPRANIFDYVSVEYAGNDPLGQPTFVSTSKFDYTARTVEWVDQLLCEVEGLEGRGTADFAVFSTYESNGADVGPFELRSSPPWSYQQTAPTDDRECILHSTIIAEVRGSTFTQTLESEPFRPGLDPNQGD